MRTVETMTAPKGGFPLPEDGGPQADDRVRVLDTVLIEQEDCPAGMRINASDFDPAKHKEFGRAKAGKKGASE